MSFWRFERRKDELDEEIQAHIQMDIAARMERGQSREDAERDARREFGNAALVRDVTHRQWRWTQLEGWMRDLAYAVRVLRRSPGFSISVVLILALGIGSACAMFTVVDRVLLRSLPYPHSEELVQILEVGKRGERGFAPYLDVEQWRKRSHALTQIAFYEPSPESDVAFLEGSSETSHVNVAGVSGNLFETLGVHPALGRGFDEDRATTAVDPHDEHSLMLSDAAWRATYSSDPAIVGKAVRINGETFTVIGVMPPGFSYPYSGQLAVVWKAVVLGPEDATREHKTMRYYGTIARLPHGASLAQAESEMKAIQVDVARAYPEAVDGQDATGIHLQRCVDSLVDGKVRKALIALFGASGLLWLIACVNVTSLMLARATSRKREIAVRGALGASHWQIVRQLLIEGGLLSGCGSVLGLGLAVAMLKLFERGLTMQFSIHERLTPNLPVLGGLFALTMVSALLISAWPAIGAARAQIEPALRQGAPQQGSGRVQHRTRALLVITEIALSLTLLVGCGLLLRTIYALKHVPLGFHTEHVIVADMTIPAYKFTGRNMTTELYQPLVDRVNHLPGVEAASLMSQVPMGPSNRLIFTFRGGKSAEDIRRGMIEAQLRIVGPEMQRVLGSRMLRGRFFNEQDTATSQAVLLVNSAFAKAYFGDNRDPGKMLGEELISLGSNRRTQVVGVLEDERQISAAELPKPEIEICLPQITPQTGFYKVAEGFAMDLAVRTERSPEGIMPELREAMRKASPDLAESNITTMDQIVEDSFGNQQLATELLEIFAGSALLLCVAGIYGLLAYLVAQRTREMGLRIALGAQRWDVMGLILRQAAWMLMAGLGIGLGLAYVASRGLGAFLYVVKHNDPWTLGAVTVLLLISGLAAAYWPARRAAMVDPMKALRTD
jgi:predicted permease